MCPQIAKPHAPEAMMVRRTAIGVLEFARANLVCGLIDCSGIQQNEKYQKYSKIFKHIQKYQRSSDSSKFFEIDQNLLKIHQNSPNTSGPDHHCYHLYEIIELLHLAGKKRRTPRRPFHTGGSEAAVQRPTPLTAVRVARIDL